MNSFFTEELKAKCSEINAGENTPEKVNKVIDAYDVIAGFANNARNEGLLALEESCEELDLNDAAQEILNTVVSLVVDGTEPELVEDVGLNMIAANELTAFNGLRALMYVRGSLMIQAGCSPHIIKVLLKSMLPKDIRDELDRREQENTLLNELKQTEKDLEDIRNLCEDEKEIDENDHSVVSETARSLIMLTDMDMQRLLRDTENSLTILAMKGLPGKARAAVFKNLSPRLGVMLAREMSLMGPARMTDVEEACVKIMKILLKLEYSCEISGYDFSVLEIVIDMYDAAEAENQRLKDKYREIKKLIDKIYG